MFIKTLTIQGFKSYRDQTAVEPFSAGHNVVVGRNGSGKSNFFSAIRFVLSDAYVSMSREERQSLLHDSSSQSTTTGQNLSSTLSAFVEIVFDNSDQRFPTSGNELVLRRTIGLKKDEYSIDRRSSSKADVGNLLEAAGFSRSNPYYIVPQGRITHLTNAKDHERLNLLKEVAGTHVYEQRRKESIKIMDETDAKRLKIDDLLKYIEDRLAELDTEKEELKEYYSKDKERRCLEYSFYQRELLEVVEVLERLEDDRRRELESSNARRGEYTDRERNLASLEAELSTATQSINSLQLEKTTLDQERSSLARQRTNADLLIKDLEERGEETGERKRALEEELERLEATISEKENDLMQVNPQWEDRLKEMERERAALIETQAKIAALHAKGGRSAQFRSRADRDAFLTQQVKELTDYINQQTSRLSDTRSELTEAKNRLTQAEESSAEKRTALEGRKEIMDQTAKEWSAKNAKREDLLERKKELWREQARLNAATSFARDELSKARRAMASTMDKSTANGLEAVDRIAREHNIEGVFGPVYSLFTIDDKYKTAVEVTANTSLFHVVVDTDETASKVLEVLNREKAGRVTFMPLNRLKPKQVNVPQAPDAILMLKKMAFEKKYQSAFDQIFGRTIICPNLEVAGAYVRSHGINAITLDGDKVERKGALTGGYHDPKRSRLDAVKNVRKWRDQFEIDSKKLNETTDTLNQAEQEINLLVSEMQILENKRKQTQDSRSPLTDAITWLREEENQAREKVKRLERSILDQELEIKSSESKRSSFQEEMRTEMTRGLTTAEQNELDRLNTTEDEQNKSLVELSTEVAELANRKSLLEVDLGENLRRRRDELSAKIESFNYLFDGNENAAVQAGTGGLEKQKKELKTLDKRIKEVEKRKDELEKELEALNQQVLETGKKLEKFKSQQLQDSKNMLRQQKSVERYLSKRGRLLEQKDKCNKSIRDLGVLPEEAFEKYTNTKSDKLLKLLHKVNESLKKFSHVNKKAVEQYNNFTKQRDQLIQRQTELENSAESIQELIAVLDQRKDEAIERTFKQVSKNFEEVFEKLVPAGRGRLIMQRRIDEQMDVDDDEEADEEDQARKSAIENYTGVSIKVSFNSKSDEGLRIQQLSGGQKSLVALATVFAIQKCDPAPFYLFDEIDANLDAQYRTSVAAMIHELSENAQFITTTFRPEMVAVAEKHYGVLFNAQKVSSIRSISKAEANEFIEAAADPVAAR